MIRRVNTFLVLFSVFVAGQLGWAQNAEIQDTRASVSDSLATITYVLDGQAGETYQVRLLISTGGDEDFSSRAEAVAGGVGEGIRGVDGTRQLQIRWRYRNRFPDGLPEELNYKVVVRKEGGQASSLEGFGVRNVRSSREGSLVTIAYDLFGDQEEKYEVTLLASASGGDAFDYKPQAISGDVGEGVRIGTGKQIRWEYREDFPDGLQQNVKYKVLVEEEGGNGWLYAIGGTVLAGGGVAVAVLTGLIGGGDSGGFPSPPAPPP